MSFLIGIMSDSHENMEAISRAVSFFNQKNVERVLHAGDIISPSTWHEFRHLNCPMDLVFGNNDRQKEYLKDKFRGKGTFYGFRMEKKIEGKLILMVHEPYRIHSKEASQKYDCIIFGHTHETLIQHKGKTLIINPGETCGWTTGHSTVALLDLTEMSAELCEI